MEFNLEVLHEIGSAYMYAAEKHDGQKRKFSEIPYISHPEIVTCLLSNYTNNKEILQAAILHDVVEDTNGTLKEIEKLFGSNVRNLVAELTNNQDDIKHIGKKQYMSKLFNNISEDALLIKLVDRLHNVLSTVGNTNISNDFVKWYHCETVYILENMNRELTNNHIELIQSIKLILNFIELELIRNVKVDLV